MAEFDPFDKNSWYFGTLSREETNTTLQAERDAGVFLVRDSTSIKGDFVLCVKEDLRISHYIINKIQSGGSMRFRIGENEFPSLPELLQFYQSHFLDSTTLIKPAQRQRYIAKYKFAGRDPDDLPFEKYEILTLVRKDEDQWWTMCSSRGQTGLVPAPYVERFNGDEQHSSRTSSTHSSCQQVSQSQQSAANLSQTARYDYPSVQTIVTDVPAQRQRTLPARALVTRNRNPSAYDSTALTLRDLQVELTRHLELECGCLDHVLRTISDSNIRDASKKAGDIVLVTAMHLNGQWEGQINGISGFFPFTHVKFLDESEENEANT